MKILIALSVLTFGINALADKPIVIQTPTIENYEILNSSDKDQVCKILTGSENSISVYHSFQGWNGSGKRPYAKVLSTGEIQYKMKQNYTLISEIACIN